MEAQKETGSYGSVISLLEQSKENQTLVRLSVVKDRGVKLSIPCKILHFDENLQLLTVYHVDDKKVYSLRLNEIDDLIMYDK